MLPACPLMHGTGQFSSLIAMNLGGCVVTLPSRKFDVTELWSEVERTRANALVIVGQAFAGPMLEELDEHPGRYDLSSVILISSSGVMWSQENKDGLLRHIPQAILFDSFGSSEAVGLGGSVSVKDAASRRPSSCSGRPVRCSPTTVDASSPAPARAAWSPSPASSPLGYYKDEVKTAQTFRTIEGVRWSVPGDWAEIAADGSLQLLGRGSVCINTGGEKVFPEEVEEVLKTHAAVRDAVCVGVARQALRRGDLRGGRTREPGRRPARRRPGRPREDQARRLQGAAPGRGGRHDRTGPERQGRLPRPQETGGGATRHRVSALRWGILGASSRIAPKAVVPALDAGDRNLVNAQASRDSSGGDAPYAELLARDDVDAVYIPLPNALHKPWVERALAAGKHVLCEKPLGMNAAEAEAMFAAADAADRVLVEAYVTPFHPRSELIDELVTGGALGDVRLVATIFTFTLDRPGDHRVNALGDGASLDLGIYCVAPVLGWAGTSR